MTNAWRVFTNGAGWNSTPSKGRKGLSLRQNSHCFNSLKRAPISVQRPITCSARWPMQIEITRRRNRNSTLICTSRLHPKKYWASEGTNTLKRSERSCPTSHLSWLSGKMKAGITPPPSPPSAQSATNSFRPCPPTAAFSFSHVGNVTKRKVTWFQQKAKCFMRQSVPSERNSIPALPWNRHSMKAHATVERAFPWITANSSLPPPTLQAATPTTSTCTSRPMKSSTETTRATSSTSGRRSVR